MAPCQKLDPPDSGVTPSNAAAEPDWIVVTDSEYGRTDRNRSRSLNLRPKRRGTTAIP